MYRDAYEREIAAALAAKPLDRDLFERCACDLLKRIHPGMAHVSGGNDQGIDGTLYEIDGLFVRLVCTSGQRVERNLSESLASMRKKGAKCDRVIFVTSQALNRTKLADLEQIAQDADVPILGIYDRGWIASELYDRPDWCKDLIDLPSQIEALSPHPPLDRREALGPLVGRDEQLAVLKGTMTDVILVGQPGAGKTAVLRTLAAVGHNYFATTDNADALAKAIRRLQPTRIIVDDAETRRGWVENLIHVRQTTGAAFSIVAACWPGHDEELKRLFTRVSAAVNLIELDYLDRESIADIIRQILPGAHEGLVGAINDQARGRPGLAVVLARHCRSDLEPEASVRTVLTGERLLDALVTHTDELALQLLAAFAAGGAGGAYRAKVAEMYSMTEFSVQGTLERLTVGGILEAHRNGQSIVVQPEVLRAALIKRVYCSGTIPFSEAMINGLIEAARYPGDFARTFARAFGIGGSVSIESVFAVVNATDSGWQELAECGPTSVRRIAQQRPDRIGWIIDAGLRHAPECVIPYLLDKAVGDSRPLRLTTEHPLRKIQDWLQDEPIMPPSLLMRRKTVAAAALQWIADGRDVRVGAIAALLAMSPSIQYTTRDGGRGDQWTMHSARLDANELIEFKQLWKTVQPVVRVALAKNEAVAEALSLADQWVFPSRGLAPTTDAQRESMRSVAVDIVNDLVTMLTHRPDALHTLSSYARRLGIRPDIALDPEYLVLFPTPEDPEDTDYLRRRAAHVAAIKNLSVESDFVPDETTFGKIVQWHTQRPEFGPHLIDPVGVLIDSIIASTDDPCAWCLGLLTHTPLGGYIHLALDRLALDHHPQHLDLLRQALATSHATSAAVWHGLRYATRLPEDLLARVLDLLPSHTTHPRIVVAITQGDIPAALIPRLLAHRSNGIAGETAAGVWEMEPKGTIPFQLAEAWRAAVTRAPLNEWLLSDAFKADSNLAHDWLAYHVEKGTLLDHFDPEGSLPSRVVGVLTASQRIDLLRRLVPHVADEIFGAAELVQLLLGNDIEAYEALVNDPFCEPIHLLPLAGLPEGDWVPMALAALNAGKAHEDVADAAFGDGFFSYTGRGSEHWGAWSSAFSALCDHPDDRLHTVGTRGHARVALHLEGALKEERLQDVFGRA